MILFNVVENYFRNKINSLYRERTKGLQRVSFIIFKERLAIEYNRSVKIALVSRYLKSKSTTWNVYCLIDFFKNIARIELRKCYTYIKFVFNLNR